MTTSSTILPQHMAFPRTFVSQAVYRDQRLVAEESEASLNAQLRDFVKQTQAAITQISPPSVAVYRGDDGRRIMITGVSILFVPATEGSHDGERCVDI